jgi:acetylornithine deacetylase/succinyl-diaminopimelate desuccinylase-like protein
MLKQGKKLPINVKLIIEGEEECGSASLPKILQERKKELKADYLAIVDLGISKITEPAITLGLRGLITMDVEVSSTKTDLHSGSHGGVAFNPIHALVQMLDSVRDAQGKIAIKGFYDDVIEMSAKDKAQVSFDFDAVQYEKDFGAAPTGGEKGYTPLERNWIRPTLEINGINGGYTGSGFKTVIPRVAIAKISCRLVPNQEPHLIGKLVEKHLKAHAPKGVEVKVKVHPGTGKATRADVNSPIAIAFAKAYSEVFGAPCKYLFSGASIPIVEDLTAASGAEVVLVGLGLPGDCIHAPNEHFGISRLELGFMTIIRAINLIKSS